MEIKYNHLIGGPAAGKQINFDQYDEIENIQVPIETDKTQLWDYIDGKLPEIKTERYYRFELWQSPETGGGALQRITLWVHSGIKTVNDLLLEFLKYYPTR